MKYATQLKLSKCRPDADSRVKKSNVKSEAYCLCSYWRMSSNLYTFFPPQTERITYFTQRNMKYEICILPYVQMFGLFSIIMASTLN